MHRFHLPPGECAVDAPVLAGPEAHHARHVLRLRNGDSLTLLDGAGADVLCEITDARADRLHLRVLERRFVPPLPWQVTLCQALPKGKLFETILQKAVELGVHRIVPLVTDRTVSRPDEDSAASKTARWRQTAIEAIKQSGSAWLPIIDPPATPAEVLARREPVDLALVGSLRSDARHPRDYFRAWREQHGRPPRSAAVWVGPEGDFTPAELDSLQAAGVRPITLGRLVLRSDTAAVCCLSVLNHELSDPA
ncbi:MAG: RsmE family RNA methyltransferase [Verrucomicrobiota bacterium]